MAERFGIKQNDNGGLIIVNSDLVWDFSDTQHIQDTINLAPGWDKEFFADGVDIRKYLKSKGREQFLSRKIKIELQSDLYKVGVPIVKFDSNGKLTINPNVII